MQFNHGRSKYFSSILNQERKILPHLLLPFRIVFQFQRWALVLIKVLEMILPLNWQKSHQTQMRKSHLPTKIFQKSTKFYKSPNLLFHTNPLQISPIQSKKWLSTWRYSCYTQIGSIDWSYRTIRQGKGFYSQALFCIFETK